MRTAIRSLRSTDFGEALGVPVGGCRVSAQSNAQQFCVLGVEERVRVWLGRSGRRTVLGAEDG